MRRLVLAGLALLLAAPCAFASGGWDTFLRARSATDMIALGDSVWLASGQAGLLLYQRSTGAWRSITREPGGLAGNVLSRITHDRRGRLFVGVPGKGVSVLDTDGRWSLLNSFDGLPSDTTLSLRAQGDTVWIGTTRGLALWDGSVVAGSVPDLGTTSPFASNLITGIAVTGDTLLVGTAAGVYLSLISSRLATWTAINTGLPLSPNIINLASDGHNVLVLASGANPSNPAQPIKTSFRWDPASGRWLQDIPTDNGLPNFLVRRLRDGFGRIYCTTAPAAAPAGIYVRSFSGGWTLQPGSPGTGNLDEAGTEPGVDPAGNVFAFVGEKLLEQAGASWLPHEPPSPVGNNARNIAWDRGSVYAVYTVDGVSRLRGGTWRNYPSSVGCPGCDTTYAGTNFGTSLLVDPLGYRWVGMWSGALTRLNDETDPPRFKNIFYASSSNDTVQLHSFTHAATADLTPGQFGGRWFGLDTNDQGNGAKNPVGIDVYDTSGTFVRNYGPGYPGMPTGFVRALAVDKGNKMWVGYQGNGLSTFDVPDSLKAITLSAVVRPPDGTQLDVFGLATYGDSIWVLAADGLHRYRRGGSYASKLQIAAPVALLSVHPLAVTPDGTLFVGTIGGVRMHRRGQLPVDFTSDNSPLANNEVRSLYAEPSGAVWIATAGGIHRFDPAFVPPVPPRLSSLTVTLYPNPAWLTGAGFELRMQGQATAYDGEIYDLNGRLVHRFRTGGNRLVVWTGRDLDQRWVGPGVYFVRVRGGGAEATARVVVLH